MFSQSKKPYSAVTVQIDRLTSEQFEEDDLGGIIDLVEVIRIQNSGPTEAARAIRKKLKYGSPHRQIRALVILDGLIENAGSRFQRAFADEPLLERLRLMPRDDAVDPQVRQKCRTLFVQWANAYKGKPGLESIANLYKELPKTSRPAAARQKVLQESDPFESPEDNPAPPPVQQAPPRPPKPTSPKPSSSNISTSRPVTLHSTSTSSSLSSKLFKDKKSSSSGTKFSLSREKENMTQAIAQSSIASTNLLNGLQLINREHERVSENAEVLRRFETCKTLRRKILYYIEHVESDEWIGSLVNANDELVKALTAWEIMDRSISDDSDSEIEDALNEDAAERLKGRSGGAVTGGGGVDGVTLQQQLEGLAIGQSPPAKPPRPSPPAPSMIAMPPKPSFGKVQAQNVEDDDDDDDDPFGDGNAAPTPHNERTGMSWK